MNPKIATLLVLFKRKNYSCFALRGCLFYGYKKLLRIRILRKLIMKKLFQGILKKKRDWLTIKTHGNNFKLFEITKNPQIVGLWQW
jgi:hypothetical protein